MTDINRAAFEACASSIGIDLNAAPWAGVKEGLRAIWDAACNPPKPSSLEEMKAKRDLHIRQAEKAAYEYFCACEVGPERERAHQVYSNILYSMRTG